MLAHLAQLIATQQMDVLRVGTQKEADVTLPTARAVAGQHGNAARDGHLQRRTPL